MSKKTKKSPAEKPSLPIPHFVCTGGCKFVSTSPGKCPTRGCVRARNPLSECNCQDGKHGNLLFLNASAKPK